MNINLNDINTMRANTIRTRTINADYLSIMFDADRRANYLRKIKAAVAWFEEHHEPFQFIAVCGVSGISVGSLVAHHLGKQLLIVRKADDTSTHSSNRIEGLTINEQWSPDWDLESAEMVEGNYVFLDDLVASGSSLRYAVAMIHEFAVALASQRRFGLKHLKFVGTIMYDTTTDPEMSAATRRLPAIGKESFHAARLFKNVFNSLSHGGWQPSKTIDKDLTNHYKTLMPNSYLEIGDKDDWAV